MAELENIIVNQEESLYYKKSTQTKIAKVILSEKQINSYKTQLKDIWHKHAALVKLIHIYKTLLKRIWQTRHISWTSLEDIEIRISEISHGLDRTTTNISILRKNKENYYRGKTHLDLKLKKLLQEKVRYPKS